MTENILRCNHASGCNNGPLCLVKASLLAVEEVFAVGTTVHAWKTLQSQIRDIYFFVVTTWNQFIW